MREPVIIANGQGFWGDSIDAPKRLLAGGPIHYLTLDYLAEVTMSIMQKQKQRDPGRGYATDFVDLMRDILPEIVDRDIKVIASAGGVNPRSCQQAVVEAARQLGLSGVRIGIVEGDDILDRLPQLMAENVDFRHLDSGQALSTLDDEILSANVYIDSNPVADALRQGAQVVITGRSTDPGLVLAAMLYEFDWQADDWDKLAAGTVAGHILECGAQATGGNFTRWWDVPDYADIGYPVLEAFADGHFNITKHPGTGGLVNRQTVTEQIVYEMGDPKNYISPDVVVDFTTIQLQDAGPDRIAVSGIKGRPATDTCKVSISHHGGYKAAGTLTISGPDAYAKAQKCSEIIWERLRRAGYSFEQTNTEFLGLNSCHGEINPLPVQIDEIVLRVSARDRDRDNLLRFAKEIAPLVTNGPPGVTGFAGGRPKPQEIVAYWPALLHKIWVKTEVSVAEV